MKHRHRLLPGAFLCAVAVLFANNLHASSYSFTGSFANDSSTLELLIDNPTTSTFSASTSSFASGGFVPVLTLFDAAGNPVDNNGTGTSDAMLSDTLAAGTYELFLTEFPNAAIGNLNDGFLFSADPTATGDACSVSGGMFLNAISCEQLTNAFDLNVTSRGDAIVTAVAATPEPSSLLLMLAPLAAGLTWNGRKRKAAQA